MLIVPFLLNGFRMIEEIISQVVQEFVVLLCLGERSVMEVCVLVLIAIFLIVIPPAAPASVI